MIGLIPFAWAFLVLGMVVLDYCFRRGIFTFLDFVTCLAKRHGFHWINIARNGDLYMRRFFLDRRRPDQIYTDRAWTAFLHYIHRTDFAPDLHDHPWDWVSIPLGFYLEEDDWGIHLCWPLLPRFRKAEFRHRVYASKPVWTIFIHFRRRRVWGFHTASGWVEQSVYLAQPSSKPQGHSP